MGLQLARRILRNRNSENKQIFIVTDGQPTAHVEGDFVYLLYPPDPRSTVATLKEAVLAVRPPGDPHLGSPEVAVRQRTAHSHL